MFPHPVGVFCAYLEAQVPHLTKKTKTYQQIIDLIICSYFPYYPFKGHSLFAYIYSILDERIVDQDVKHYYVFLLYLFNRWRQLHHGLQVIEISPA